MTLGDFQSAVAGSFDSRIRSAELEAGLSALTLVFGNKMPPAFELPAYLETLMLNLLGSQDREI
jgi:hypothetical protein